MAHIRILLATWNGARYLPAQLESIAAQSHGDWSLWCSDDGSEDDTRAVIERFAAAHPDREIRLFDGPRRGSAANFLSLLARAPAEQHLPERGHPERPCPEHPWLAFCDQDDVWMPGRLARAAELLGAQAAPGAGGDGSGRGGSGQVGAGQVYASRTILTDADLSEQGPSRRHRRPPAFANALVQNILAGNTIVADAPAAQLLQRTASVALGTRAETGVPHHDWWIYQIATGTGARIVMDDRPGVYYRQHGNNTMAAHRGLRQSLSRLGAIRNRHYADWIDANLAALSTLSHELTPQNRALLERFARWRAHGRPARGKAMPGKRRDRLGDLGIHRQSLSGDLALAVMARTGHL